MLSRGEVVDRGLPQTPQLSDDLDRDYGIWYDAFFDSVDIHERVHNYNQYGPVTFVFSIDLLDFNMLPHIKITQSNPVHWHEIYSTDRYFESIEELNLGFRRGCFGQHITFANTKQCVPFSPYLERVILDNPRLDDNRLFDRAKERIELEIRKNHLSVELIERTCIAECKCIEKYHGISKGAIWYKYTTSI